MPLNRRCGRNIQISSCDIVVKHGHFIINIEAPRIVFTQMIFIVMFTEPLLSTSSSDRLSPDPSWRGNSLLELGGTTHSFSLTLAAEWRLSRVWACYDLLPRPPPSLWSVSATGCWLLTDKQTAPSFKRTFAKIEVFQPWRRSITRALSMLTNLPVPYDLFFGVPISFTVGWRPFSIVS